MRLPAVTKKLAQNTKVYACGPERLLDELISLSENWNDGALNYEHFTSKVSVLNPDDEHAFDVILKDSDVTVNVRADQTILEALLAKGIDVPYDCQEGICGTCEVGVLKGQIDHRDQVLTKTERGQGDRMMACCSRAKGNSLMLVL
jgi:ferredoxin